MKHIKKIINKLVRDIKTPKNYIIYLLGRKIAYIIPDKLFVKLMYRLKTGRVLNIKNPITFDDKMQWLKLYDRNPFYTQLVDKYEVRKYIAKNIGEEYLFQLLGVWDRVDDIDFSKLPMQFVLKCTHDSGSVYICKDKNKFDIEKVKKEISKALKKNYYYHGREWIYKNIKPRIICEKYMVDKNGVAAIDHKFMCFNGKAKFSYLCLNRNSTTGTKVDCYDMNWKELTLEINSRKSGTITPKPNNFNKMIEIAEKISNKIIFLRVDFYNIDGKLYLGELTFYLYSGWNIFKPSSYNYILGSWLNLKKGS